MNPLSRKILKEKYHYTNEQCYLMPDGKGKYCNCPIDAPIVKDGGCAVCRIERWLNNVSYSEQTQNIYRHFYYAFSENMNYADYRNVV